MATASRKSSPSAAPRGEVAEQIAAFGAAGASHVQLVVDPITLDSIEWFSEVLSILDAR